eukprot:2553089-Rhodomonas_salina.4
MTELTLNFEQRLEALPQIGHRDSARELSVMASESVDAELEALREKLEVRAAEFEKAHGRRYEASGSDSCRTLHHCAAIGTDMACGASRPEKGP